MIYHSCSPFAPSARGFNTSFDFSPTHLTIFFVFCFVILWKKLFFFLTKKVSFSHMLCSCVPSEGKISNNTFCFFFFGFVKFWSGKYITAFFFFLTFLFGFFIFKSNNEENWKWDKRYIFGQFPVSSSKIYSKRTTLRKSSSNFGLSKPKYKVIFTFLAQVQFYIHGNIVHQWTPVSNGRHWHFRNNSTHAHKTNIFWILFFWCCYFYFF